MISDYERMAGYAYRKYLFREISKKQFLNDMGSA